MTQECKFRPNLALTSDFNKNIRSKSRKNNSSNVYKNNQKWSEKRELKLLQAYNEKLR